MLACKQVLGVYPGADWQANLGDFIGMNLLRAILDAWRRQRTRGIRRVIVVVLEGLDIAEVDYYLEQGLLHYLALMSDIGTRFELNRAASVDCDELCRALRAERVRGVSMPRAATPPHRDLDEICATDRAQQEQMIAALRRRRNRVVACRFDMLKQLARLFGPHPSADEQLIVRDVYARMDEVVGKALSFLDGETVLMAVIGPQRDAVHSAASTRGSEVIISRPVDASDCRSHSLAEIVLRLLEMPAQGK
jgi:hypothetical protein